jgi:hypothetical protein
MTGKLIKIKSDSNEALKKLLNDLDVAETINEDTTAEQNKKWTPEEWYQQLKKRWYFHGSSWYMRQALHAERLSVEQMKIGCNGFTGCISECRFYPPEGRIEEDELQNNIQSLSEFVEFKNKPCSKQEHQQEGEEEQKKNEQQSHE